MDILNNNSLMYPSDYHERLAENRAILETEEHNRNQLAEELSGDLGIVAMAAVTGIAGPERSKAIYYPTAEQSRKLGQAPVRHLVVVPDNASLRTPLSLGRPAVVEDRAVVGYAEPLAA